MKHLTMKKMTALGLAAVMSLSLLTSCGDRSAETPAPEKSDAPAPTAAEATAAPETKEYSEMTLEELKPLLQTVADGKLTMVTSPDFAPAEFYAIDDSGNPTLAGHDIALGHFIADYIGLELEIVPIDFNGVLMEIQTKSADMAIAGLANDPKRESIMDFSTPYSGDSQSFVCLQSNKDQFPNIEASNKAEYQIGAQLGSIQLQLAELYSPNSNIVQLAKVTDIVAELVSGKLDGAYISTTTAENYAKQYPELCVILQVENPTSDSTCVGVVKDNPALLAAINLAVTEAVESGKMEEFRAEAKALAEGATYEGLLDENGKVQS